MPGGDCHTCNECGYEVETYSGFSFYIEENGNRISIGHPVMMNDPKDNPIGVDMKIYCPDCDHLWIESLTDLDNPKRSTMLNIAQYLPKEQGKGLTEYYESKGCVPVKCPQCGSTRLLLSRWPKTNVICPRCCRGVFISRMSWVS